MVLCDLGKVRPPAPLSTAVTNTGESGGALPSHDVRTVLMRSVAPALFIPLPESLRQLLRFDKLQGGTDGVARVEGLGPAPPSYLPGELPRFVH